MQHFHQVESHINKAYIYAGNRFGLDYFLNIPSSRLDWMHPQHPWLEKYLTEKPSRETSKWNFMVGIHRYAPDLKSHLGMINITCLSILCIGYHPPLLSKTPPPLSCQASLKSANCPSPPLLGNSPQYIDFSWTPPPNTHTQTHQHQKKKRFFSEHKFFILHPIPSFKSN